MFETRKSKLENRKTKLENRNSKFALNVESYSLAKTETREEKPE